MIQKNEINSSTHTINTSDLIELQGMNHTDEATKIEIYQKYPSNGFSHVFSSEIFLLTLPTT